jgi:hypothetical protein
LREFSATYPYDRYTKTSFWDLSLWMKWLRLEVDHWPPSGAGVQNKWSCTSTFLYAFMTCTASTLLLFLFNSRTGVFISGYRGQ